MKFLSDMRRLGILSLIALLVAGAAAAGQSLRTSISLDTAATALPLIITLDSMNRDDVAAVRIEALDPTRISAFAPVPGTYIVPVGDQVIEIRTSVDDTSTFRPSNGWIIGRFVTTNSTWEQEFAVDYLNRNRESITREIITVLVPRDKQEAFYSHCRKKYTILNTPSTFGSPHSWRMQFGPNGSGVGWGSPVTGVQTPAWVQPPSRYIEPSSYNPVAGRYRYIRTFCVNTTDSGTIAFQLATEGGPSSKIVRLYHNNILLHTVVGAGNLTQQIRRVRLPAGVNQLVAEVEPLGVWPPSQSFRPRFVLWNASVQGDLPSSITSEWCECDTVRGAIRGRKIRDVNCNGRIDPGELNNGMQGWTIRINGSSGPQQTTTDVNGFYEFTDLPFGYYYVSEQIQPGWTATAPGGFGYGPIFLGGGNPERNNLDFLNCLPDPISCDSIFTVLEQSEECCTALFEVSSSPQRRLQKLEYEVQNGSGIVNSVSAGPCGWSPNPTNLSGTTSGALDFTTPCAQNTTVTVHATATNATGEVCIEWRAIFQRTGTPIVDTCVYTTCIRCPRMVKECRTDISVTPLPGDEGSGFERRKFTIHNLKVPISPIAQVDIEFVPEPGPQHPHSGGIQIFVDGPTASQSPYVPWGGATSEKPGQPHTNTQIRLDCGGTGGVLHGPAAVNDLSFTLDVYALQPYPPQGYYDVHFTIIYCDGDTCEYTFRWEPEIDSDLSDATVPASPPENLRAVALEIDPPAGAATVRLAVGDTNVTIVAASAAHGGGKKEDVFETHDHIVQYNYCERCRPRDTLKDYDDRRRFTVIYSDESDADSTSLTVTFFDVSGRALGTSTLRLQSRTLSSVDHAEVARTGTSGLSLVVSPNPARESADITLHLRERGVITVDVLSLQGVVLTSLTRERSASAGSHTFQLATAALANGTYLIRVRTEDGDSQTVQLRVVR